jgi:predicted nuclease with TOPRIM domain
MSVCSFLYFVFCLLQAADELVKEKPELAELIEPKISELSQQFNDLERTTKEKGERLFDANREVLLHQTCDDIDTWMNDLEKQIESEDTGTDLASVNILMQKQQVIHYVVPKTDIVKVLVNAFLTMIHTCCDVN